MLCLYPALNGMTEQLQSFIKSILIINQKNYLCSWLNGHLTGCFCAGARIFFFLAIGKIVLILQF